MWAMAIASDGYTLAVQGFGAMIAGTRDYLWYVNRSLGCVCRIHIDGTVTTFPWTPLWIVGLAIGPDGNLWFKTGTNMVIGRMSPTGVFTTGPTVTARPSQSIVAARTATCGSRRNADGVVALTPESQLEPSEIHLGAVTPGAVSQERSCYATWGDVT
jgi:hypothetical protein